MFIKEEEKMKAGQERERERRIKMNYRQTHKVVEEIKQGTKEREK